MSEVIFKEPPFMKQQCHHVGGLQPKQNEKTGIWGVPCWRIYMALKQVERRISPHEPGFSAIGERWLHCSQSNLDHLIEIRWMINNLENKLKSIRHIGRLRSPCSYYLTVGNLDPSPHPHNSRMIVKIASKCIPLLWQMIPRQPTFVNQLCYLHFRAF
jgi:hypothetical protein